MAKTQKKRFLIKYVKVPDNVSKARTKGKENQNTSMTNRKNRYTSVSDFPHKMESNRSMKIHLR